MSGRIVAYVPDLMDRSRLSGFGIEFVAGAGALGPAAGPTDLVLVDLARPGALDAGIELASLGHRVVGFAPHVDEDLRSRAAAGGVEVLARSRFFRDPATALGPD